MQKLLYESDGNALWCLKRFESVGLWQSNRASQKFLAELCGEADLLTEVGVLPIPSDFDTQEYNFLFSSALQAKSCHFLSTKLLFKSCPKG